MKIIVYSNLVFIPILGTNKYLSSSISGIITSLEQFTKEEIITNFGEPNSKTSHYCDDFNDLSDRWSKREMRFQH